MLVKIVRNGLGLIFVGIDKLTRPKAITRTNAAQAHAQQTVAGHTLYQLNACPFCVKTRRAIHQLNVDIPLRDIGKNDKYRKELSNGGGRTMVPCLRIEEDGASRWMYESGDIIAYLQQRVSE